MAWRLLILIFDLIFIYLFIFKEKIYRRFQGFRIYTWDTFFSIFWGKWRLPFFVKNNFIPPPPLPTCKKLNHYFLIVNRNWNHKNLETKSRYKILKIYTTSLCQRFNRINSKILHHLDSVFEVAILTWGDARAMAVIFTFQNPSLFFVLVRSSQFSYSNIAQELTSD